LNEVALAAAQALYLFSPLLVASAISGIVLRFDLFSALKRPIDAGRMFRGHRLLGDSKTWRGVAVAVVGCTLTASVQKHLLVGALDRVALVDYRHTNELAFGFAMGAGAMLGELPNSFVKRRLGIAPGATRRGFLAVAFYVWDQIDLLTTAWPLLCFWVHPTPLIVMTSGVLGLGLHPAVSLVGYLIRARRTAR
jgi:hypothetical protein